MFSLFLIKNSATREGGVNLSVLLYEQKMNGSLIMGIPGRGIIL